MQPGHWRDDTLATFGQRSTAIDVKLRVADPGIKQERGDPLFLRELVKIAHHLLYKEAAPFFIRRACFTVIGEPPFRNPAGLSTQRGIPD